MSISRTTPTGIDVIQSEPGVFTIGFENDSTGWTPIADFDDPNQALDAADQAHHVRLVEAGIWTVGRIRRASWTPLADHEGIIDARHHAQRLNAA